MRFNRIFMYDESSELNEAQNVEEETSNTEVQEDNQTVDETVTEQKTEEKPTKKKTLVKEKIIVKPVEDKIVEEKQKPNTPIISTEQENLILRKVIETGFDAEVMTAMILKEVVNGSNPFDNLDDVVRGYVEKYPQMLKIQNVKPKPTEGIAPSNQTNAKQKETEQRQRYFGNSQGDFWKGSGIRQN